MNRISVMDFINDNSLLEVTYTPFDQKLEIVTRILNATIETVGEINTSIVRKISTQVFINNITNIDLSVKDKNGLDGYDQLCYCNQLDVLKSLISSEYIEFETILTERISDYARVMNSPVYAIGKTYDLALDNEKTISILLSQGNDISIGDVYNKVHNEGVTIE